MNADAEAALLGTRPMILSLWEERFGYPVPVPAPDGQRFYPEEMMVALRDALGRGLSVASAITEARRAHPSRARPRAERVNIGNGTRLANPEQAQ